MYEELVGRLRAWEKADVSNWRTFKDAADAIEDLTAQLEKANEVIKADTNYFFELSKPKEKLA